VTNAQQSLHQQAEACFTAKQFTSRISTEAVVRLTQWHARPQHVFAWHILFRHLSCPFLNAVDTGRPQAQTEYLHNRSLAGFMYEQIK